MAKIRKHKSKFLPFELIKTAELSDSDRKLILKAVAQTRISYAPYSNFFVGAALLLSNDTYLTGCNQENASYPLCICAERVALYNFGSKRRKVHIKALAISAFNPSKSELEPCMPCGACRQVILEFEQRQNTPIRILATSNTSQVTIVAPSITTLLPSAFDRTSLLK